MTDHAPYRTSLAPEERGSALVAALRALPADGSPAKLPGNGEFLWYCGSVGCVVGLGWALGLLDKRRDVDEQLALDDDYCRIFYEVSTYGVVWKDVTPAMVADELERALDGERR